MTEMEAVFGSQTREISAQPPDTKTAPSAKAPDEFEAHSWAGLQGVPRWGEAGPGLWSLLLPPSKTHPTCQRDTEGSWEGQQLCPGGTKT